MLFRSSRLLLVGALLRSDPLVRELVILLAFNPGVVKRPDIYIYLHILLSSVCLKLRSGSADLGFLFLLSRVDADITLHITSMCCGGAAFYRVEPLLLYDLVDFSVRLVPSWLD